MQLLSETQYDYLRQKLLERGLAYPPLVDEIIDHVCSATEAHMERGINFSDAAEISLSSFTRDELETAQQTTFSTTTKHKQRMKTLRIGLIISYCLSFVGLVLKALHTTGANEALLLGLVGIGVLVALSSVYRYDTLGVEKLPVPLTAFRVLFSLGVLVLAWGVLSIGLRWPFRYEFMSIGLVLLAAASVAGLVASKGIGFSLASHRKLVTYNLLLPLGVLLAARITIFLTLHR